MGTLIEEWEEMEKDQKEWEVVEGIRRGGRRADMQIMLYPGILDPSRIFGWQ